MTTPPEKSVPSTTKSLAVRAYCTPLKKMSSVETVRHGRPCSSWALKLAERKGTSSSIIEGARSAIIWSSSSVVPPRSASGSRPTMRAPSSLA